MEDPCRKLSKLPGTWGPLLSVGHIVVSGWAPGALPLLPLGRSVHWYEHLQDVSPCTTLAQSEQILEVARPLLYFTPHLYLFLPKVVALIQGLFSTPGDVWKHLEAFLVVATVGI